MYARGVNASITAQRSHLPSSSACSAISQPSGPPGLDSGQLAIFRTHHGLSGKLGREALAAHLSADLMADLCPEGSWRDHYPGQPALPM